MRGHRVVRFVARLTSLTGLVLAGCAPAPIPPELANQPPPAPVVVPSPPWPGLVLTPNNIDGFILVIANAPKTQIPAIRQAIAKTPDRDRVIGGLSARLLESPVTNVGRRLMILAVLGELKSPRAIAPLEEFIWSEKITVRGELGGPVPSTPPATSYFPYTGALKARAAEMLAYIGTQDAFNATLEVAGRHPLREVRVAAIDAYLYNHGDSAGAREALRRVVPQSEAKLIGIPRRTHDMDVRDFDRRLDAFYAQYPEERPPVPVQGPGGYTGGAPPPVIERGARPPATPRATLGQ